MIHSKSELEDGLASDTVPECLKRVQLDWQLNDEQMAALNHVPVAIYRHWMTPDFAKENLNATIPPGMKSAVPLIAVYQKLRKKFPDVVDQVKWLTSKNADFGGHLPIDIAASSEENLFWISYYLDSSRDEVRKNSE